jgi:hypothetical protein
MTFSQVYQLRKAQSEGLKQAENNSKHSNRIGAIFRTKTRKDTCSEWYWLLAAIS